MGRYRGVPFEFPIILLRLLRSPRRAGGRTNKMKSNKYSNYNSNQEVLTELLGQLMRSGGRSSNGYSRSRRSGGGGGGAGGSSSGLSRNRGNIRRSAVRSRRRVQASGSTRSGNPKPATAQTSQRSGGGSTSTSSGQKRSATDSGGPDKKKTAVENKDDASKEGKNTEETVEDPYLKGLSESGVRWYLRFLKEGLEPKLACKKAWEQYTDPAEFEPQWGKEFLSKEGEEEARLRQRSRRRNSKRSEINEDFRIAVHPKDFPDQMLDLPSVVALEAAIMADVAKGADAKLQFTYAHLRPGALLIDCVNEETVNWLKETVPKLTNWDGPELTASQERVIPDAYVMTVGLGKSCGQEFERTLALISAQNEDLNTEVWKLVNEREENEKQVVTIRVDKDSFNAIKRNQYKLFYRFERVNVHFHRYLRYGQPTLWITNPSCYKQNQVKPPGPSGSK